MHKLPAVSVVPVNDTWRPLLLKLAVAPEQHDQIGTMADILADVAACPGSDAMVIVHGDEPVGFYRLDPHARSVAGHDLDVPALGLRTFFIDVRWQRRGIGSAALVALIAAAIERHRGARLLALTVSVGNAAAMQMYRRAGFIDGGELYHGGRCGPMRLLLRTLP